MGAPEGTTVVAKSQSSGAGRFGRSWKSPLGGLYMSFVLRPDNLANPQLVSLVSALAVVHGVKRSTGLATKIRWPNDVMAGRKKLAGIIAEAQSYKQEITQVVVGVGLNCNAPIAGYGEGGNEATSIVEELGKPCEVSEVKHSILDSFSTLYANWREGQDMMQVWQENLGTLGKHVTVGMKTDETPFSCVATGVDPEGGLVVSKDGAKTILRAEEVEWLREGL